MPLLTTEFQTSHISGVRNMAVVKPLLFNKLLVLLVWFTNSQSVLSARILGVIPTPSYSHQIVFRSIWKELANRGHEVVVITTNPINDTSIKNLREINVHSVYDTYNERVIEITEGSPREVFIKLCALMEDVMDQELSNPEVHQLIQNKDEHFDLIMVEYLFPAMYGFVERFKVPYIGLISLDGTATAHGFLGNPTHPVMYPESVLPFAGQLKFSERVIATLFYFYRKTMSIVESNDLLMRKHFGSDARPLYEIMQDVEMVFINTNPVTYGVRPSSPTTVFIGGGIHIEDPKPLPDVS